MVVAQRPSSGDKEIVAFCNISLPSYEAGLILKAAGFGKVRVMDGGIAMWPFEKLSGPAQSEENSANAGTSVPKPLGLPATSPAKPASKGRTERFAR